MPTPRQPPQTSQARDVGRRAIANTLYRSSGEILGRLASLALFAEVGRHLGETGLGAFVFAIAYLGFVMIAVDLGLDRYMLRVIARERTSGGRIFFDVLALKTALAVVLLSLSLAALHAVGYETQTQWTVLALTPGVFADSLARTQGSFFLAHERGGPPSLADAIQRICSAALGIAALQAGYGIVAIAASYSIGSWIGVALGFLFMRRTLGLPALSVDRRRWRTLASNSIPFAAQDTFTVILARMDTLLLAVLATEAVVGRYGAAYRLFESTFLIAYALAGAFAAMYTYLEPDGDPPLASVFARSLKLALVLLMPLTVAFAVLAEPICRLIYGPKFTAAATPLEILAPGVVLMGVVILSTSLMVSRDRPSRMIPVTAAMAGINVVLNLILIPTLGDAGAATAMLCTEVLYAFWILHMTARKVTGLDWPATLVGTIAAAVAMTAVTLLLRESLAAALVVGTAAYAIALFSVESWVNPRDVAFVVDALRRRLPASRAA